MLTTTAFAAPRRAGGVSWSGLSLRFTRLPSSLYTFRAAPLGARLGSGLPYRFRALGFPEFGRFYARSLNAPQVGVECDAPATLLQRSYESEPNKTPPST